MYKAIFDNQGNRITSYHTDIHTDIPMDAIEISAEDQDLYATNEYIRDIATGKPVVKPPYVPTTEEKVSRLDIEYQPQFTELSQALGMATLAGNTDLITGIKADYTELKAEYEAKRGEVIG